MGRERMERTGGLRSSLPRPRVEKEEQVREICELKKALNRTRQELQRSREINRTSSDEEGGGGNGGYHEGMTRAGSLSGISSGMGSRSGSINGLSSKPSLNRELVSKLRSMTETIKMLSTENVALREENDNLLAAKQNHGADEYEDDPKLENVVKSYEDQLKELDGKVKELEGQLELHRSEKQGKEKEKTVDKSEKDKYKSLARRLKEERNNYKEMVEDKRREQDTLKEEIEKMTEIIGELRHNCGQLQEELLSVQSDPSSRREISVQTSPMTRRASLGDISRKATSTPKRSRSNMSSQSITRQQQLNRTNELSKPKTRALSSPGSPSKGPKIAKPVTRPSVSKNTVGSRGSTEVSSANSPARAGTEVSSANSPASPRSPGSRIPGPSPSKIPTPSRTPSRLPRAESNTLTSQQRSYTVERTSARSSLERMSTSNSEEEGTMELEMKKWSSRQQTAGSNGFRNNQYSRETSYIANHQDNPGNRDREMNQHNSTNNISNRNIRMFQSMEMSDQSSGDSIQGDEVELRITEENDQVHQTVDSEEEEQFPAPPPPEHLAKLSMEAQFKIVSETVEKACDRFMHNDTKPENSLPSVAEPDTPRTTRKVDNFRQKLAARRIQRTWKHFYQELEEKRADDETLFNSLPILPTEGTNTSSSCGTNLNQMDYQPRPPAQTSFQPGFPRTEDRTYRASDQLASLPKERVEPMQEDTEDNRTLASVQAAILSDELRTRGLSFLREEKNSPARTRGGIFTARPWLITSESESDDEEMSTVQGIVRSHSFRLGTITEGDVFSPGKVSSIRAKFNRLPPDGESDTNIVSR